VEPRLYKRSAGRSASRSQRVMYKEDAQSDELATVLTALATVDVARKQSSEFGTSLHRDVPLRYLHYFITQCRVRRGRALCSLIRSDRAPACDGHADGQTPARSRYRAIHMRCAVKSRRRQSKTML